MADLSAARLADVAAFFRTHYVPNNALLCVAGDFEPEQARQWIDKYFGPLPRARRSRRSKPNVPRLPAAKHIQMTDAVSLPRAQLLWPTVPADHPDEPALDVLAAVLGGLAKENRLFRALMYDRQLAAQVGASHPTQLLSGTFEVELYARPGQKLDELVKIADAEIQRLRERVRRPLEVRKAQNERESGLIMGLQSVTHKASVLNQYTDIYGDPLAYRTELDEGVRGDSRGRQAGRENSTWDGPRIELDISPARRRRGHPRCRSIRPGKSPWSIRRLRTVKDEFDRSVDTQAGPDTPVCPAPLR